MGGAGTLFLGAAVAFFAAGILAGLAGRQRLACMVTAAISALLVKMLGNITGLFYDGSTLEWLLSVIAAILATLAFGQWVGRRDGSRYDGLDNRKWNAESAGNDRRRGMK